MSFSPLLEDDGAVLEAALAFLDASEASSLLLDDEPVVESSVEGVGGAEASRSKLKGRRKKELVADVRRRKRRKDERLALFREAQVLEQRLALLQRSSGALLSEEAALAASESGEREWERRALAEAHASVVARDVNQKLKAALKRQHALLTASRDALARAQPRALLDAPPRIDKDDGLSQIDTSVMTALKRLTIEQYDTLDRVISPSPPSTDMVSSNLAVKMDPIRGMYSEHTTTTVVPKELSVAAAIIEESLLQLSPPCADLEFLVETSTSDVSLGYEKQYAIRLRSPGRTVPLNGVGFIRIYREPQRVVFLVSTRLDHSLGFRFHERCWFIAARSPTSPAFQSVARSYYRLEVEKPSGSCHGDEDEVICSFTRTKLTARMRDRVEAIQAKLLETTVDTTSGRSELRVHALEASQPHSEP